MTIQVGIAGFRGYSGAELVEILSRHPRVRPVLLEHRADSENRPVPLNSRLPPALPCSPESVQKNGLAAVFLATPPEISMQLAPSLLAAGAKVIDLSGAYRLGTAENYKHWYKEEHTSPELLAEAVYGLPEYCRKAVPGARLVSNPGCYPTAANLAIRPLVEQGIVDRQHGIVCDAKSGVSGAGRKPSLKTHFCEVTENFAAYSILEHRHVPEVLQISGLSERELSFTAQLIPIHRGILETIYFRAAEGTTADRILEAYQAQYGSEPFVRLYKPGQVPDLKMVQRTNFCDIGFRFDPGTGRTVVVSVIDNLVKGAAGQAIQNMNLALGFDETAGLL
jgi:N-acetyl-gamma-glutamyl-phosphate reductase